jgi:hypothetical protein
VAAALTRRYRALRGRDLSKGVSLCILLDRGDERRTDLFSISPFLPTWGPSVREDDRLPMLFPFTRCDPDMLFSGVLPGRGVFSEFG